MSVRAEDRLKIKEYTFEAKALKEFLDKQVDNASVSLHVIRAVRSRLRIIESELKHLGAEKVT